jgi:hypothetical protein
MIKCASSLVLEHEEGGEGRKIFCILFSCTMMIVSWNQAPNGGSSNGKCRWWHILKNQ